MIQMKTFKFYRRGENFAARMPPGNCVNIVPTKKNV